MTASTARISVRRRIAASAVAIFLVLTHAQGHVSIDGSETLTAARGVDLIQAVGDVFEVAAHDGHRVLNTVTALEPNRSIEWTPVTDGQATLGQVYGFFLDEIDEHTTQITAYVDWAAVPEHALDQLPTPAEVTANLERTLAKLDALLSGWRL